MALTDGIEGLTPEQITAINANETKHYEGYESAESIKGLKDNNTSLLAEKHEQSRLAKEAKALADKAAEDGRMSQARDKGSLDDLDKSWQEKFDKQFNDNKSALDTVQGLLDGERSERHNGILNSTIDAMALEIGGTKENAHMMRPHIAERMMMHEGKARVKGVDGSMSALTQAELSGEFRANPVFAGNVVGSLADGGGASNKQVGNGGANTSQTNKAVDAARKSGSVGDFLSASFDAQKTGIK